MVALLEGGDFFGEGCLAGRQVRTSSVVAMEDSAIMRVQKDAITRSGEIVQVRYNMFYS